MPMVTGKKHRYAEMIDFGSSPCSPMAPSTTMTIGAIARIGTICEQMTQGSRLFSSVRTCTIADGEQDAEQGAEHEADQRGRERHPGVVGEAARRIERIAEYRVDQLLHDLMRRRQHRPLPSSVPAIRSESEYFVSSRSNRSRTSGAFSTIAARYQSTNTIEHDDEDRRPLGEPSRPPRRPR